jgi:hypothetical protein
MKGEQQVGNNQGNPATVTPLGGFDFVGSQMGFDRDQILLVGHALEDVNLLRPLGNFFRLFGFPAEHDLDLFGKSAFQDVAHIFQTSPASMVIAVGSTGQIISHTPQPTQGS